MGKYDKMTHEDFVKHLQRVLSDQSANDMLAIPGVWEVLSEHFNNEALESWEAEQEMKKEVANV